MPHICGKANGSSFSLAISSRSANMAGYVAGGVGNVVAVDKFGFLNDTRTTLGTGLSYGRHGSAAFASSQAGYVAGGNGEGGVHTTIDKFLFYYNDTRQVLGTGLSVANEQCASFESSNAGYVAGGIINNGTGAQTTDVQKFQFLDDSRSTLATGLSVNNAYMAGFNSANAGYVAGGCEYQPGGGCSFRNRVEKFTFSNDSRSILGTGLSANTQSASGFESSSAGYVAGGTKSGVASSTVEKYLFSNDSRSLLSVGLSSARTETAGFSSVDAGYVAGGGTATTVDKFSFVNDSRSTLATGLSIGRRMCTGFSDKTV